MSDQDQRPDEFPGEEPGPASGLPPLPTPPSQYGYPIAQPPATGTPPPYDPSAARPGKATAIAGMMLGGGIMGTLWGLALMFGFCIWLVWPYQIVIGILAIVHGAKMLSDPYYPPSRTLPILMMVSILGCDVVSLTIGILCFVFANDPEVKDWYLSRGIGY